MVRGGRDHCGTRIPSFYDGDDGDVDDVDKDYIGDQGANETKRRPKKLVKDMLAKVQIKLSEIQCLEMHENIRSMGKVVIRQENHTIAAGHIIELIA